MMSNVASLMVGLVAVPLTLRALGTEGYGTFQVLTSLGNIAAFADAGLGLAVLTRVGQLAGAGQHDQIRQTVGGALLVIAAVVVVVAGLAVAALRIWDVPAYLKVPLSLQVQAQHGCLIVVAAFSVRMLLSVFSSAHAGMQITHLLVRWSVGSALVTQTVTVAVATATRRLDLALGGQAILSLLGAAGAARLGCALAPATRPLFGLRYAAEGWHLLRSGFVYYLLQIEVLIIGSIDNVVIAKLLGVQAVALYSLTSRAITLAFSMVYSLGVSFWGGVAQAIGSGDIEWIRTEASRMRRLGTLWMAVIAGGFAAVGAPVIALWTGGRLLIDPWLPVALGTYYALLGHTMIDASILNGAEKIRQQVVTVGFDAILNLTLSVLLARRIGYTGVGLGTLVAYATCTFLPQQIFSWRLVVKGSRPPFWTRSLTTVVLSIASGVGIHRLLTGPLALQPLAATLIGGVASVAVTLVFVRVVVGREGIETLVRTLRRRAPAPVTTESLSP
jgi:O-antigen/teichoic acid export membrane protein